MIESLLMPRENFTGHTLYNSDFLDLDVVVKNVLGSRKERFQEIGAIVRQDAIPPVRGNEQQLVSLFSSLVEIILNHPPNDGKLFIYIRCVEKDPASDDKKITISIHTNTCYGMSWEKSQADILQECGNICKQNGGDFMCHLLSGKSCLFTINLQGK